MSNEVIARKLISDWRKKGFEVVRITAGKIYLAEIKKG